MAWYDDGMPDSGPAPDPAVPVVPAELRSALDAEPAAAAVFDALPPSHQREYTEWVGAGAQTDTRERRARRAVERLLEDRVGG